LAKVDYTSELNGNPLDTVYEVLNAISTNAGGTKGIMQQAEGIGYKIVLFGSGFVLGDVGFTAGKIEKAVFFDSQGDAMVTMTGDFKAKRITEALQESGIDGMIEHMHAGDDTIDGSKAGDYLLGYAGRDRIDGGKGGDFIGGGAGRDVMSGGPGGDVFIFGLGDGNDVVLDFDADPAGGQDRLWITDALTLGKNADNDAVITLEDGSTLTLVGVRKGEIEDGDFYSPPEML
jgi:hypothetical protein